MYSRRVWFLCLILGWGSPGVSGERLAVHEWGTFTVFQNEAGEALKRINTDDEPVPDFVHQMANAPRDVRLFPPTLLLGDSSEKTPKGPRADVRVRMRLETPVLYFHLPAGQSELTLDVEVDFRRGFLTQFFPNAAVTVDGQPVKRTSFPKGKPLLSTLKWSSVRVGPAADFPETQDQVWLAPRQVQSAPVTVGNESEQFLFYRGVGMLESPVCVLRTPDQILDVRLNPVSDPELNDIKWWTAFQQSQSWWLLEVRPDGQAAYRRPKLVLDWELEPKRLGMVSGQFADAEFSADNLGKLRTEMRQALIEDGLYADEAEALLKTWQLSYFQSPGQRLFFLVPRNWTDHVLPLRLSVPADVQRVMVGRVELVTPRQRDLVRRMSESPVPDLTKLIQAMHALQQDPARREDYNALASGRGEASVLQVAVPPIYQAFLDLGRFRTSLLLDALERDRLSGAEHLDRVMQFQFELLYPGQMKRD